MIQNIPESIDNFRMADELHPIGAFRLALKVIEHMLESYTTPSNYNEKIQFITKSKLFEAAIDVMGYDVEKVRQACIKVVEKSYQERRALCLKLSQVIKPQ